MALPPRRSLIPGASRTLLETMEELSIDPRNDTFKIMGAAGVVVAHVSKPSGQVLSARVRGNSFRQLTQFDPAEISVAERREIERQMYSEGMTQSEIGDLLGVSQSLVAKDLSILRNGG
ncbi:MULTISPECIES: helix-turn-helix domain-containing protein [Pseudomonas syringae group]|jgi:DNA-binding transcriptional regulator LsrR (DeoR family)|uniref:Uncharacterized protein n=4 Tax=Pseudomonas syringae group TaxID=136849 RepID=F3G1W2_PSESJ|nr:MULTISPECIES: helix-turn-helix domain-containing protein [Pseudomonas syringae group]EGH41062.1 hypothetical protein PSYPI_00955 [Pseudomonas syringae pv. pisi str. 1704B]RMU72728.1 hypothetical protein ALP24_102722 [Pseudomonas syringae pv. aptata]PYD17038.1 hypothetical protein DND62_02915 [Pseudomonas syringae pv. pisi]PYD31767.1 hypothetical protein DND58_08995 [Pseudomonas syringae pv. pisi]PYD33695.1 hypothetical protein DND67_11520 [Pseudomonas syringae pv. pisi]